MGKNAASNSLVDRRQVEPDDEVTVHGPAPSDHRMREFLLFQGFPNLRGKMSARLNLRRHLCPPGLKHVPEEPERERSALLHWPCARPRPARAAAFMVHEAVNEADVELVETRLVS